MQVHWFSLLNSFMMVLLLCGIVAYIILRSVRNDYTKLDSISKLSQRSSAASAGQNASQQAQLQQQQAASGENEKSPLLTSPSASPPPASSPPPSDSLDLVCSFLICSVCLSRCWIGLDWMLLRFTC